MADKKISELTPLLTAVGSDIFAIVDNSTNETKNITVENFLGSPGPIGVNTPDAAVFTTLELQSGVTVNNISQNPNLGTSNSTIPTQGAVKAYVDSKSMLSENVRRVSSDTTAVAYDIILVDTTNGNVTIEMLDNSNGKIVVKKLTSDANQINVITSSGALIDNQASIAITNQFQSYYFYVDTGEFFVI